MKTVHKKPRATKPGKEVTSGVWVKTLPSKTEIKEFLTKAPHKVAVRDVARAFSVPSEAKKELRGMVKELAADGTIERAGRKSYDKAGKLPETALVEVTGIDRDGEALARPVVWDGPGRPPIIFMAAEARGQAALAPGARVLARLRPIGGDKYEGRTLKRVAEKVGSIVGVFQPSAAGGRIEPTDRRQKAEWLVPEGETMGAQADEIVRAEPLPGAKFLGPKPARVTERLGSANDARSISLIAIATHGIPMDFPDAATKEAERATAVPLSKRTDLREVPLITIDGADARDFDDAVHAEPIATGHRLIVAIADVAHYVRPGSALDKSARERGNSCYFPDRVVPMLPEALSNGWCSLKPDEPRGCLFVEMFIDRSGRKTQHKFGRGLMRSAARKTYEEVQAEYDEGGAHAALYDAFAALKAARDARGTLDLDLPERKVTLGPNGQVLNIAPRPRLDSHKLIEEFMILANVCAAEELERHKLPCMYRVHAPPSAEKLDNLRSFLNTLDISLKPGDQLHPRDLDQVLKLVAGTEQAPLVNETVLRSQSQAEYAGENIGHFGLALSRYAHFTSPIRRYADLLVHRALITGLKLGKDGLSDEDIAKFEETAEQITMTERRATLAERDSTDRYLALFLQHRVGESFTARVSGVTKFGLFVTLPDSGASGFLSMSSLGDDYWVHDEASQSLIGKRTRRTYQLAQMLDVRLAQVRPVTGGLLFTLDNVIPMPRGEAPRPGGKGKRGQKSSSKPSADKPDKAKRKLKRRR